MTRTVLFMAQWDEGNTVQLGNIVPTQQAAVLELIERGYDVSGLEFNEFDPFCMFDEVLCIGISVIYI